MKEAFITIPVNYSASSSQSVRKQKAHYNIFFECLVGTGNPIMNCFTELGAALGSGELLQNTACF